MDDRDEAPGNMPGREWLVALLAMAVVLIAAWITPHLAGTNWGALLAAKSVNAR